MNIKVKLKYLFHDYRWVCAYRRNHVSIEQLCGELEGYQTVKLPKRYWAADPFLYKEASEIYLFVELTDTKKKKSALAAKRILPAEEQKFHVIYEFPYHTSYPCIFKWGGKKYIIPETKSAREIVLLECVVWPFQWKKKSVLMTGIDAADCTPYIYKGKLYLMIYEENESNYGGALSFAELDVDKGVLSDKTRLKKYEKKIARPGGNISAYQDGILMVRQPGIRFYGEKVEFVKCTFTEEGMMEKKINEIVPKQLKIDVNGKIVGVHTYNRCGDIEVVDLFVKKFNATKPLIYIFHKLRVFGFGEYERDKKIRWKKFA